MEFDPRFSERLLESSVLGFGLLQGGNVGIGVFPNTRQYKKVVPGRLRYCGSPTLRTSSANRGSERMGSSQKSVFKPSSKPRCALRTIPRHPNVIVELVCGLGLGVGEKMSVFLCE